MLGPHQLDKGLENRNPGKNRGSAVGLPEAQKEGTSTTGWVGRTPGPITCMQWERTLPNEICALGKEGWFPGRQKVTEALCWTCLWVRRLF